MKRHIIINVCTDNLWNKEAIDKIEGRNRNSTISVRDFNTLSQQLKWQQNNIQLKELKKISKNKHDVENSWSFWHCVWQTQYPVTRE